MRIKLERPIIVDVMIIGKRKRGVKVLLDTGATNTILSWDTLKDIGYDPAISTKRTNITTANGVIEAPLVRVKEISIGDFRVKDIDVLCHDIPELIRVDGLLGLNFIENFRVCIDYKKEILEIE
ncbi:MAG: peptidase A2A [Candidatus Altiarchaeales archaeon HGW-Altiarchaeales-1]|nr:MAG: peptidase A2A [Candidatus Altiarchaeales archaeon HGW-Altiarchaeales-2]PKP57673.1 MAG: peptidase A2A [Candidatus Altiarchaeales archaeon HGW-Altiarchaeales-1]